MGKILTGTREGPFHYFETHCGKMSYILAPDGEWQEGIGRCADLHNDLALHPYCQIQDSAPAVGSTYHGSWSLAAAYLRRQGYSFRFTLCDTSEYVGESVKKYTPRGTEAIEYRCDDGFPSLKRSAEGQHLILIDPPYAPPTGDRDWARAADTAAFLAAGTIPFLIWYPLTGEEHPHILVNKAGSPGYEILWSKNEENMKMAGAGMVMGNCSPWCDPADFTFIERLATGLGGTFHVRDAPAR
jgi:23S rRNA A2030 N6-methylase RlmJ